MLSILKQKLILQFKFVNFKLLGALLIQAAWWN